MINVRNPCVMESSGKADVIYDPPLHKKIFSQATKRQETGGRRTEDINIY